MDNRDPERELARMLGEGRALSRIAWPAAEPPAGTEELTDATSAVTLRIEPTGTVAGVVVAANWRDRIPAAALGATVRDVAVQWQLRPLQALADAATEPAGPPAASAQVPPAGRPAREPDWDELTAMLGTVQRALALLPELTGAAARSAAAGQVIGRSANRRVAVTLAAGQVVDVTVDEAWAERANRQPLSDALTEAFADAYELGRFPAGAGDATPDAARVAEVTQDLQAVVQRLGVVLPPGPSTESDAGGAFR